MGLAVSEDVKLLDNLVTWPASIATADGGWIVSGVQADGALVTARYDTDGSLIGSKIVVTHDAAGVNTLMLTPDGGWLQHYQSQQTVDGTTVYYENVVRFDADGQLVAEHHMQSSYFSGIVSLATGNHVIFSGSTAGVTAAIFDAVGNEVSSTLFATSLLANGSNVITYDSGAWSLFLAGEGEFGTYQLYGADGELLQSVANIESGRVTFDGDGSYQRLYNLNDADAHTLTKVVERYDANGSLLETITGSPINYSQSYMGDTTHELSNGNTVVVWTDHGYDYHGHLFVRVVGADGGLITPDLELTKINPYWGESRITELAGGGWVVEYQFQPSGQYTLFQVFNADGTPHGEPLPILGNSVFPTDDGGWTTQFVMAEPDGTYSLHTRDFLPNDINNAPLAVSKDVWGTEDTANTFFRQSFAHYEPDGDEITHIVIEELPALGTLRYDGAKVTKGQIIDLNEIDKLTWMPPSDAHGSFPGVLKFNVIDEHGEKSKKAAEIKFTVFGTDDAPTGDDLTLTIREDERVHLTRNMLPVFDIDGEILTGLDITPIVNGGTFTQGGSEVLGHTVINWEGIDAMYFQAVANESGDNYAKFAVKYITAGNSTSEEHMLTINVLSANDAPISQNEKQYFNRGDRVYLNEAPQISDVEGHDLKSIVITSLPETGRLKLGDVLLNVGDEILADDIDQVNYSAGNKSSSRLKAFFEFHVRDSGGVENGGDDLSDKTYRVAFDLEKKDVLSGTMSDDILTGSRRADIVQGGAGGDVIFGGRGEDEIYGGSGGDVFVLRPHGGVDTIYDFSMSEDRIDLRRTRIDDFEELKEYIGWNTETIAFVGFRSETKPYGYDGFNLRDVNYEELNETHFIFG
ncbi:hypothetical protein IHQ71_05965 [Rhizobium sp. TH2]|uniref:hypothetical protein n=1 Tax=Rhizobium sp. TH2 TaxID=2775403 RepID=UPI002157B586|nr:hypothetical protein [Rhizobium sp. TH2]UVC10150.1 hypothetical protein IHQ71_05965 [Rhizobium sp. TH2]